MSVLTAQQIQALQHQAGQLFAPVESYLLQQIGEALKSAGKFNDAAAYQLWRARTLGTKQRQIVDAIRKATSASQKMARKIIESAASTSYGQDLQKIGKTRVKFSDNLEIQQIMRACVDMADSNLSNITQTLGMISPTGAALPLQSLYREVCDFAFNLTSTGSASYTRSIELACDRLAAAGLQVINYQSGRADKVEVAVRRNIMSGLGAMCENIASYNHDDLGCDGWEISAHAASAPDHEPIQGRQYTDADYKALNDSLIRRIGTLNCGHIASPIILGVSKPQYSSAELAQLEANNAAGVTYQGQHYTTYEATQLERSMERSIRADKRRVILARAAGLASHESQLNARVLVKDSNLRRFCKATGLRYQPERLYVPDPG